MTGHTGSVPPHPLHLATRRRAARRVVVSAASLALILVGCGGDGGGGRSAPPNGPDPCPLVTQDLLERLAPGGERVADPAPTERDPFTRSCGIDLTSTPSPDRGDLSVAITVSNAHQYDDDHQSETCAEIGAEPSADGPGDTACLALVPNDGVETRIDGYAWIGDDHQAEVHLQLVETPVPATAEADLRELLAAAVASFPEG